MFAKLKADKEYFAKSLTNAPEISLLILETINCDKLAEYFLNDAKVEHVIYFTVKVNQSNHKCEMH